MEVSIYSKSSAGALSVCENGAAMCTNSRKPAQALRHAMESEHNSVLEHAVYTFEIHDISRVALAQLTRHRIASFSVQSQRYINQENQGVVVPPSIQANKKCNEAFERAAEQAMLLYKQLIDAGIDQEDARYILPQGIMTSLQMTMNARELGLFFSLRCCNRAQWEIRELADKMLALCREDCPEIFGKAGPSCRREGCHEKRPCGRPRTEETLWET